MKLLKQSEKNLTGAMIDKEHDVHDDLRKIEELRASSAKRFKNTFEDIMARYSTVPEEGLDEIDIMNLEIVEDHGRIKRMKRVPCGYYASKYRRPKKERKILKKLVKKIHMNPVHKNLSPKKQSDPYEKTQEKLINSRFSPKNMKIPILKSSPLKKKLCRDSITSLDDVIKNDGLQNNKLQIISDLFTFKRKEPYNSEISMMVNVSPNKKKRSEDSLTSNECMTPKNTPSNKKNRNIEHLFNFSRSSSTPRRQQELCFSVKKLSLSTPKNGAKRGRLSFDIPSAKKSKLELLDNSSQDETPALNKGKAFDLNQKRSSLSKGEKNMVPCSSTPRHQRKLVAKLPPPENNTKGNDLASLDFSLIKNSKLEKNSSAGKISTSKTGNNFHFNQKTLSSSSKIHGSKYESPVTPVTHRMSFLYWMKRSPQVRVEGLKEDDIGNISTRLF